MRTPFSTRYTCEHFERKKGAYKGICLIRKRAGIKRFTIEDRNDAGMFATGCRDYKGSVWGTMAKPMWKYGWEYIRCDENKEVYSNKESFGTITIYKSGSINVSTEDDKDNNDVFLSYEELEAIYEKAKQIRKDK